MSELFEKNKREKKDKIISDSLEKVDSKDTKAKGKSSRNANVSNKAKQSTSVPESPVKSHAVGKAENQKWVSIKLKHFESVDLRCVNYLLPKKFVKWMFVFITLIPQRIP